MPVAPTQRCRLHPRKDADCTHAKVPQSIRAGLGTAHGDFAPVLQDARAHGTTRLGNARRDVRGN